MRYQHLGIWHRRNWKGGGEMGGNRLENDDGWFWMVTWGGGVVVRKFNCFVLNKSHTWRVWIECEWGLPYLNFWQKGCTKKEILHSTSPSPTYILSLCNLGAVVVNHFLSFWRIAKTGLFSHLKEIIMKSMFFANKANRP